MGGTFGKSGSWVVDHTMDDIPLHDMRHGSIATVTSSEPPPNDEITTDLYETPAQKKARKRSHWVAYTTMFVMSIGFSIVLSGVWPFLQKLNSDLKKNALGPIVAANPLGQMIASPLLGLWGNKAGKIRFACLFTVVFFMVGNIMYALLYVFKDAGGMVSYWAMFAARFIVGVSSANVTLCRSYLAGSTTLKERTSGIAIIAAAQALGFVVGPGIQTVVTLLVKDETVTAGGWIIWDKFTACGWVAAFLGLINFIILTPWFFQEYNIAEKERALMQQGREKDIKLPKPDYIALTGVLFAFFVGIFVYVLLETLAEPFVSDQYAWDENKAIIVVGIALMGGGFLATGLFPLSGVLARKYDERKVMLYLGFIPLIVGSLLFIPFAGKDIPLSECSYNTTTTMEPTTTSSPLNDNFWGAYSRNAEVIVETCTPGCPLEEQPWCAWVHQLPQAQLVVAFIIIMSGYPLAQSLTLAIFSKLLGPKPQGLWMGVVTGVGSLARVLGPIFVSLVYTKLGTVWCFSIILICMVLAFIELHVMYPRLKPMKILIVEKVNGYDGPAAEEKEKY